MSADIHSKFWSAYSEGGQGVDAVASETGDMGMGELGRVMVVYWF